MLSARLKQWLNGPLHILKTRQNVVIIQLYPKHHVMSVSYKGKVVKGHFADNTLRNLMRNGKDFNNDMTEVLTAIGNLLQQLIQR